MTSASEGSFADGRSRENPTKATFHSAAAKGDLEPTYKDMARFRNRIVHLYDDIDPKEIWRIAQIHSDNLQPFIALVIEKYLGK
ncbi:MAG: DUF86 domain-containing protein [Firmicutes bacterium]|nr:DUF86 domain-containing protein [Bacillota bacterium]